MWEANTKAWRRPRAVHNVGTSNLSIGSMASFEHVLQWRTHSVSMYDMSSLLSMDVLNEIECRI